MKRHFSKLAGALSVGVALGTGGAASAAMFTPITPNPHGEPAQAAIFSHVYGGNFTPITGATYGGPSFTNGTITAERLPDDRENQLDQVFPAGAYINSVQARYAKYEQDFGYSTSDQPTVFNLLFSVHGAQYSVSQSASGSLYTTQPIYFARSTSSSASNSGGLQVFSDPDLNNGVDRLATYQLTGDVPGLDNDQSDYVLFFDDGTIDKDYNDLVVEVRASGITESPEPATGAIALALLGGALALPRRAARSHARPGADGAA